jgi:signal transduction histidine kinase
MAYINANNSFKSDINNALEEAVEKEAINRRKLLTEKYKAWISDTSMIEIHCDVEPVYQQTRFFMKDRYSPYPQKSFKPFHLSFDSFTSLLDTITPQAREFFIKTFLEGPLQNDLKNGWVYFYTQRLGDSLTYAMDTRKADSVNLKSLYKEELKERDIEAGFRLLPAGKPPLDSASYPHATRLFWTYGRFPVPGFRAWFPHPTVVFVDRMKWVLASSFLLTAISLYCFYYTITTLLRQKKLSELKNDFVNNMTHELKTPVATIGIAAEAIQTFELDKAYREEYAGIIREQAANLSRLIDHILKSAIEEEPMEMKMEKLCIKMLVEEALLQIKPQIEKSSAVVQFSLQEQVFILGNQVHLTNVVINLLDNALKYSHEQPLITIGVTKESPWVMIEIADQGIGIEDDYQQKVFERFFRVPTGNIHTVKGYGLGLSYAKSIIEKHKGFLLLESRKNQGTRLTIKLPLPKNERTYDSITGR